METKQTAVEWLVEQLYLNRQYITYEESITFEKAKAMEKEQMKNAVLDDVANNENMKKKFADRFEQHYNETYGK